MYRSAGGSQQRAKPSASLAKPVSNPPESCPEWPEQLFRALLVNHQPHELRQAERWSDEAIGDELRQGIGHSAVLSSKSPEKSLAESERGGTSTSNRRRREYRQRSRRNHGQIEVKCARLIDLANSPMKPRFRPSSSGRSRARIRPSPPVVHAPRRHRREAEAVHPGRRAGVPGPAASADVRRVRAPQRGAAA